MQVSQSPVGANAPDPARQTLISALREAASLEHKFMAMYLVAAMSLKQGPDAACDDAQYEQVRRWNQTLYMIARQEMEHLSIVNSLLAALGAPPWFGHDNFQTVARFHRRSALAARYGAASSGLQPCEIPFLMRAFDVQAARRFACMESPALANVPAPDRARVLAWGFHATGQPCSQILPAAGHAWPHAHPKAFFPGAIDEVEVGTIEQLYTQAATTLKQLVARDGEAAVFSGASAGSAQEQVPTEYQIYLFPITDLRAALAAIDLVMQQGEGIQGPPGYGSHFSLYLRIAAEYEAELARSPNFVPHLNLLPDAHLDSFRADPVADALIRLFHDGYVTLLLMLTGYYALYRRASFDSGSPPYLSAALQSTGFGPMMTMFVRSVAEVLTSLPAGADPQGPRAGPVFDLLPQEVALLAVPPAPTNDYGQIGFYAGRVDSLLNGLAKILASPAVPPAAHQRLEFVRQNMTRLRANLGTVDRDGIYPLFKIPASPA